MIFSLLLIKDSSISQRAESAVVKTKNLGRKYKRFCFFFFLLLLVDQFFVIVSNKPVGGQQVLNKMSSKMFFSTLE